jgi:hypothetical protein
MGTDKVKSINMGAAACRNAVLIVSIFYVK